METKQKLPINLPLRVNGSEVNTSLWLEDANGRRVATIKNGNFDLQSANMLRDRANAHDFLAKAAEDSHRVISELLMRLPIAEKESVLCEFAARGINPNAAFEALSALAKFASAL